MKGADKFCELFPRAEQIGRLYLLPHYHARGKTFRIYVLPEGEKVIENGGINPPLNCDAIEVYGVIAGSLGWTEEYGWKYEGPWQQDFMAICEGRLAQLSHDRECERFKKLRREKDAEKRISKLLSDYR